jgi:hypothetical protein
VEAVHGEKMIEVRVKFWTNGIAEEKDHVLPRHGCDSGMVNIERNAAQTRGLAAIY